MLLTYPKAPGKGNGPVLHGSPRLNDADNISFINSCDLINFKAITPHFLHQNHHVLKNGGNYFTDY